MEEKEYIKLNYALTTPQERNALVQKILDTAPPSQLTPKYLEILSNYILDAAITPAEKKSKTIISDNRQITIDKRETSYEKLVSKFENGEDGVYNLINNDKNMYLTPKIEITEEDIAEVPGLAELRADIEKIEAQIKTAVGKTKHALKKQSIEMHQQQYILKELWRQPHRLRSPIHTCGNQIEITDDVYFDQNGDPTSDAIVTFFKPAHISAILCNYDLLSTRLAHKYSSDFHYLMRDFDKLLAEGLDPYPAYRTLVEEKIDGKTNAEVAQILLDKHNLKHTPEYISSLWRNKIPKILSDKAKNDYLIWYDSEVEYGNWKRCTRCGEFKLAHNRFFSKNSDSKDGFYSICKSCRSEKNKEKK